MDGTVRFNSRAGICGLCDLYVYLRKVQKIMPLFPLDKMNTLYNSTSRLNQRFRGKEKPTVHHSLAFLREEMDEFEDAFKLNNVGRDSIEHVIEEMVDVLVTSYGLILSMGLKIDSFNMTWMHLWNGRSDLKAYSTLEPDVFNPVDVWHEYNIARANLFQFMKVGNVTSARTSLTLIMTNAVILALTRKVPFHVVEAGIDFVIAKNDSKTERTHFLNKETGKITRRQNPK